jgi:hypothetical protein
VVEDLTAFITLSKASMGRCLGHTADPHASPVPGPQVYKEWLHPVKRQGFSLILIALLIHGILIVKEAETVGKVRFDGTPRGAVLRSHRAGQPALPLDYAADGPSSRCTSAFLSQVFVWIAAPLQLVLTVMMLGSLLVERHCMEHVSPAWIITPVGNLVAALALVEVDQDYLEAAYLW